MPARTANPTRTKPTKRSEGDEQPGMARGDQGPNGERRPRRRGRRGGRRRRGNGPEDGLVGSIADELGPTSAPEAANAVADFDGGSPEPAPTLVRARAGFATAADRSRGVSTRGPRVPARAGRQRVRTRGGGNRAGGRPGRRAAAFDRARKGQLPDQRAGRAGAGRRPQRTRAGRAPASGEPEPRPPRPRRARRAGGRGASAAASRTQIKRRNRPAKPGGFFDRACAMSDLARKTLASRS